ncbi:hypothetical protein [Herbidospora sp. RD11066]
MERARQLLGDLLILLTLAVIAGGVFLGSHYAITDDLKVYSGSYEPLRGVMMPEVYEPALTTSFEVRGGLLTRQLHSTWSTTLLVGLVIWAAIGRYAYALPAFALACVAAFAGMQLGEGNPPVPVWFAVHVVATVAMAAILGYSSWREARERPISFGYVAAGVGVLVALGLI